MRTTTHASLTGARRIAMAVCATTLMASVGSEVRADAQTSNQLILIPSPEGQNVAPFYPQSISSTGLVTGYYASQNGYTFRTVIANVAGGSVAVEDAGYVGGNLSPTDANYNGEESYGFGINAGGIGAGTSFQGSSAISVFGGYPIDKLVSGPNPPPSSAPYYIQLAAAINNAGTVVGVSTQEAIAGNSSSGSLSHAVVLQNGSWSDLSLNSPYTSGAFGINGTGNLVVGFQSTAIPTSNALSLQNTVGKQATVWTQTNGSWSSTSLGTLVGNNSVSTTNGPQSVALSVNNSGDIVGVSDNVNGGDDATLWQPNGSGGYTAVDLSATPSNRIASPGTLSDPVYIAGGMNTNSDFFKGNPLTNVLGGNVSSVAESINNNGQIVGFTYAGGYGKQAFLTTVGGSMVTLNSLLPASQQQANGGPWDLEEATSINDQGQIVGWGSYDSPTQGYENEGFEFTISQQSAWTNANSDYWETANNWSGAIPNAACATAIFSDAQGLTAPGYIYMQSDKTVGHLTFNSVNSYSLISSSGARLIVDDTNDISGATPSIVVSSGSHTIYVPIVLATNGGNGGLTINTFPGTSLTLAGTVTASNTSANSLTLTPLTLTGAGNVVITQTGSVGVPLVVENSTITFAARTNFNQSGGNGILVRNVPSISFQSLVGSQNTTSPYTIGEGNLAQVVMAPASNPSSRQVLVTSTLNFTPVLTDLTNPTPAWEGYLDLANNDLIVLNGNLAALNAEFAEGYDPNGYTDQTPSQRANWNGIGLDSGFQQDGIGVDTGATIRNGIVSSTASADTTHLTALGVIQNSNLQGNPLFTTFDSVPVGALAILAKYTYYGDANLDGVVNSADYTLVDYAYLYNQSHPTSPLTGWYNGDFNYDGVTNGSDYTLMDNAFNMQGVALSTELAASTTEIAGQIAGASSAVPEPACLGMISISAVGMLARRRRRD